MYGNNRSYFYNFRMNTSIYVCASKWAEIYLIWSLSIQSTHPSNIPAPPNRFLVEPTLFETADIMSISFLFRYSKQIFPVEWLDLFVDMEISFEMFAGIANMVAPMFLAASWANFYEKLWVLLFSVPCRFLLQNTVQISIKIALSTGK